MAQAEEVEYKRGEVIEVVEQTPELKKSGKSIVMVWDGKKAVKVTLPTQYVRKVEIGELFPFKIVRDPKTKQFVSHGRRGL